MVFSYSLIMSLTVLWRGFAGMLPLFMASSAIAGIFSTVTPTSDRVAGMPSCRFRRRNSSTSSSGVKFSVEPLPSRM